MADEHGFPTVRERELEIKVAKLQRENDILRRETQHLGPLKAFDEEHVEEVQCLPHEFRVPMLAKATVEWEEGYTIRVVAHCWPHGKTGDTFEVATYVSETVVTQSFDPFEAMMHLHKIALEKVARRATR